jgi:DNA-binding GntR family transcriptional regulator
VDEVHERLVDMIVRGHVLPYARLHQERLAADLEVSRTPGREALLRLEREGWVYTRPHGGMFVRGVTPDQVRELYEVRQMLEPRGARLACERAGPKGVEAIKAIQRRHERHYPKDVAVAFRTNSELHLGLVRACDNQLLLRFLQNIWDQDAAYRIFAFYTGVAGWLPEMVKEHRRIVNAFAAGDSERVEELLRGHIESAFEALLERLQNSEQGRESARCAVNAA